MILKNDTTHVDKNDTWIAFLGSYEDPFAIIGGVCLSACRISRGLLGGIQ